MKAHGHPGYDDDSQYPEDHCQMVDIYGAPCDVHAVRTFRDGRVLGAGYDLRDPATWFVYDSESDPTKANGRWHKHCGPYSTFEQAKDWCLAIRAGRTRSAGKWSKR